MSFNRSLLTQITKDLADKKKPAMPKAGAQQKIGESNPYYIDKSDIAGKGAFAKQFIPKGSPINMLHQINQPGMDYDFTQLGKSYNHSEDPNTINRLVGNKRFMVANQDIFPGQELTGDYRMQPDLEQPQEDWKMKNGGEMIKRADGSYSKRGLWDNIRANRGSGKKPTKQMLEQERKIKAKMQGGGEIDIDGQALQGLGKVFSTIGDVMSIPARGVVKALTGKYQDPSQALGVTNPVAAWLTNSLLDPTNLVGAGVAAKVLGTAGKASKASKIVKGVDQAVGAVKGADKVAGAGQAYKIAPPRNIPIEPSKYRAAAHDAIGALTERGMILDQQGAFRKPLTPNDVEYFGTLSGRPVVGVNTPNGPEYFYKSTAWAPKTHGTVEGEWQAFGQYMDAPEGSFEGVKGTTTDWFVKGDRYKQWYDSHTFKNIAKQMDNVIMQKYGLPEKDLDKFLNFQNRQGWVDTFTPPRKAEGGESDNVTKFMEVYQMKYGGGTPAFKQGGQTRDEREMVNGIADILSKVKDRGNRGEIAQEMIQDFEDEGVTYNVKKFMDLVNLKYGGTPYTHLQEGGSTDITSVIKNIPQEMVDESTSPYRVNILRNAVRNDIATNYGKPLADVDEAMVNEKTQELLADKKAQLLGTKLNLNTKLPGTEWASYNPNNQSISFTPDVNNMPVNQIKDIARHEYNHAFDDAGYYLTKYEKEAIKKSTKAAVDNSFFSPRSNEVQYLSQPTEVNARLRELRGALKDQGIYDGSKEDATLEHLNKGKKIRAYGDLLNVMPDKEIVNLLNTIASNNPKQGMPMAQEGGEALPEPVYTGSSVVDYLTTLGFESSKGFRKQLAKDMGIQGYNFSAAKNLELLNALKEAKGLPIGYEESFDPVSPQEMIALEQQRGVYAPMPEAAPVPQQVVSHPVSNKHRIPMAAAPAPSGEFDPRYKNIPAGKPATSNVFRIPMAAPANPYAGFLDPRIPQNTVPASKAPVAAPVARGKINPFAAVQQPGTFPGGFNQQAVFNAIKNAPGVARKAAKTFVNKETAAAKEIIENIFTEKDGRNNPFTIPSMGPIMGSTINTASLETAADDIAGLWEKAVNYFDRKSAMGDGKQERKSNIDPKKIAADPIYMTGDTIPDKNGRYHTPEVMDLNYLRFGTRNRGDYRPIDTEAGSITAFKPFEPAKDHFAKNNDPANSTYLGVGADGKIKVGSRADFQNGDYKISKTFSNKVVDFNRNPDGSIVKVKSNPKASKETMSPSVKVLGDDGKVIDGKLSLLLPKSGNQEESFDLVTGGRYIMQTPDGKFEMVSGSLKNIEERFNKLKKGNPYVNVITLDNGSYSRGIRTYDKKLTAKDLKKYDNQNTEGGNFAYLMPGNPAARYDAKFNDFQSAAQNRLQSLYPGKKVEVKFQNEGVYDARGSRAIESQADILKKGYSQAPISMHNFDAARDYVLYVDGKPIDANKQKKVYKDVLWKAADQTGMYHLDDWDVVHIGLAKEGQKTAFNELYSKFPDIFASGNFKKSVAFIEKNKNNPAYKEAYELLHNIKPYVPKTQGNSTAKKQYGGSWLDKYN